MAGFKYIIQTELQLSPGSVNALLADVAKLDRQLKDKTTVSVNARIDNNSISALQRQVGNMRATLPVQLRLDKNSIANFKREVDTIIGNAKREIEVAVRLNQSATANGQQLPQTVRRGDMPRLQRSGAGTNDLRNLTDRQIREYNAYTRRMNGNYKELESQIKAQILEEQKKLAIKRQEVEEEKRVKEQLRAERESLRNDSTRLTNSLKQQKLEQAKQRLQASGGPNINTLEASLKDNSVPMAQKVKNLNTLIEQYRQLARATGENLTKSFTISDSTLGSVRTTTREFTRLGEVIDKGDRSFQTLGRTMARNIVFYSAISMGFMQITQSILSSVASMAQFESQFLRIQQISNARNEASASNGLPSQFSSPKAKSDIFNLGKRYGLNPTTDITPIYTDLIRRSDIAKSTDQATKLTRLVVRAGLAFGGNDVQGADLQKIGQDFTSIYSQMFSVWDNGGKGDKAIVKMSRFIDTLAAMGESGADIGKSMDAIADLVPYVKGAGKLDLNYLSAIVSTAQHTMADSSGAEISSVLKMMFGNLLNSDMKNEGSANARKILGVQNGMSLQDMLLLLSKRVEDGSMSGQNLQDFASSLASSAGGTSGAARSPQFQRIIEKLPEALELYNSTLNANGKAEELAIQSSQTLRGEWQKLLATMQEFSVALGDSGVLAGIKTLVKDLNILVSALTNVLEAVSSVKNILPSMFGDSAGGAMNNFIGGVVGNALLAATLFKGGQFAGKFLKGRGVAGGAGVAGGTGGVGAAEAAILLAASAPSTLLGLPWPKSDPNHPDNRKRMPANIRRNLPFTPMYGNGQFQIRSIYDGRPIQDGAMRYYSGYNPYSRLNSNIPHFQGATRLARLEQVVQPSRFARAGSAIGTAANAAWLFATFRGGPGVAKAGEQAGGLFTKLGKALGGVLPALGRFALLLSRLSIWGAVIGGIGWGISALYKNYQRKQDAKAQSFNNSFATQEGLDTTNTQINRAKELIGQGMPSGLDEYGQMDYRYQRQQQLLNYSQFGMFEGTDPKLFAESEEFNKIIDDLKSKGIELDKTIGSGNFAYKFMDEVDEKRKSGAFNLFDDETMKEFNDLTESIVNKTGTLSMAWDEVNGKTLDYANTLSNIAKIQDKLQKVMQAQQLASKINQAKFIGAEDSSSYFASERNNILGSISNMSSEYATLKAEMSNMNNDSIGIQTRLNNAQASIMGEDGKDKLKEIQDAFNAAKESGQVGNFAGQYDVRDGSGADQRAYDYARALADAYQSEQGLDEAKKSLEEITQTIADQVTALKQLQIAYLVASGNAQTFEGVLKGVKSEITQANHAINMAGTYEQKQSAMADSFSSMAKEAKLYKEEVASIQASINDIVSKNSGQDFSLSALYNPGADGITAEQAAVKQLTEQLYDAKANQVASLEALQGQVDAMKELVLNSDKYKSMWDSVNAKIDLSKSLVSELRDLQSSRAIAGDMANLQSTLTGEKKGDILAQGNESRRDSYIQITEQIKKAMVTYGDDAKKLKEALAEIKGTYTDKIKAAFLEPLKEIVDTDLQGAADTQINAADAMRENMDLLQTILQTNLDALNQVVAKINGEEATPSTDSSNMTQEQAQKVQDAFSSVAKTAGSFFDSNPFLKKVADFFKPVTSVFSQMSKVATTQANQNASLTSGNAGSTGVSWQSLVNKKLNLQTNVTAEELDAFIDAKLKAGGKKDSLLKGKGATFIKAAQESGLDPVYLLAHAALETGWGTSNIAKDKKNFYGIGAFDSSAYASAYNYNGTDAGIIEGAKWISRNYTNGKYGQDTLGKMRFNDGVHQYATDGEWANSIAQIMASFGKNAVTGTESTVVPTASDSSPKLKDDTSEADLKRAFLDMLEEAKTAIVEAFREQGKSLISQKDNIKLGYENTMSDYVSKMGINGFGKFDYKEFQMDSLKDARLQIADAIKANQDFLTNTPKYLAQLKADANDKNKSSEERQVASAQYNALAKLWNDGKFVKEIQKNTEYLKILSDRYAKEAYKDPTYNGTEALKLITQEIINLSNLMKNGKQGGLSWYQHVDSINSMFDNYFTRDKAVAKNQKLFDNTGEFYGELFSSKKAKYSEDVTILAKSLANVKTVLDGVAQGTNAWHIALEDYIGLQERVIELENKKTQFARRNFELNNTGLYPYINARAHEQSRDYVQATSNRSSMTQKYQTSRGSMDATEQLVALQIISESHDKAIQQMNDYRDAVTGAFKAGAISLQEYMFRLNDLRDTQNEVKSNAVAMAESIKGSFSSNLASAIKDGMQGSFDAPMSFIQNIKDSLAGAVSTQMSNIVLQQSGLGETMNGLITSLVGSMTSGNANKDANAFNLNNFKKQLDDTLNPFLPIIQQISDSTQGIFGILKDQTFNAPSGFKIDDYLYEIEKAKGIGDIGAWYNTNGQNEAGSPNPTTGGSTVVLPPVTHVPSGVPNVVTKPIEDVLSTASTGPVAVPEIWNPVKEAINGIITMQENWKNGVGGLKESGNSMAHTTADEFRDILKQIPGASEIAKAIGNGISADSMGIEELQSLLSDSSLSQFDMVKGIDGVNSGIGGMSSTLAGKLDNVVSGLGSVVGAINAGRASSGGSSSSGGSYGGSSGSSSSGSSSSSSSTSSSGSTSSSTSSSSTSSSSSSSSTSSSAPKATGQQAYLDSLQANGTAGQQKWANQYEYLNNLTKEGTAGQQKWAEAEMKKNGMPKYHTGGIGGAMNFASAGLLKPNEFQAILQNEETIFQKGQLGSFVHQLFENSGFAGGISSQGGGTSVNVQVNVDGAGSDEGIWQEAISRAVTQAVNEVQRQGRLTNLRTKGVAY